MDSKKLDYYMKLLPFLFLYVRAYSYKAKHYNILEAALHIPKIVMDLIIDNLILK